MKELAARQVQNLNQEFLQKIKDKRALCYQGAFFIEVNGAVRKK